MDNLITEHIDIWTSAQEQKPNVGRGRGKNSNGQTSYGIKKLRELILELAVCGKLVPQDPNDEPASGLLEKIAREKARLIKEGKIKKQKPLPEINEDEKPFELPKGWEWVRLGDVIDFVNGFAFKSGDFSDSGVGIVKIGDIQNGEISTAAMSRVDEAVVAVLDDALRINKGDLLIAMSGATTGKLGFNTTNEVFYLNQRVGKIVPYRLFAKYLYYPLTTKIAENLAKSMGSAIPNLSTVQIKNIVFALPPLAEQHRVVAKVDELMALCDQLEQEQTKSNSTHQTLVETLLATLTTAADQDELTEAWQRIAGHFDTLFTSEQSIDQLKQTILQLAVMGKLVPQDPMDLPAPVRASHAEGPQSAKFFVYALECEDKSIYVGQTSDILKRWKEHAAGKGADWTKEHPPIRLVHWEEYDSREEAIKREKELKTGFGRKWIKRELAAGRTRQAGEPASVLLAKIAKEKARLIKEGKIKKQKPLPKISEDEKPFNLPDSWEWTYMGECFSLMSGTSFNKKKELERGKYIYIKVADMNLEGNEVTITTSSRFLDPTPKELNALIPAGSIIFPKRGGAIATNKKRFVKNDLFVDLNIMAITPFEGIDLDFAYRWLLGIDLAVLNSGTSVPQINNKDIVPLLFPLPPLEEQHRIVVKVDELMDICDTLKGRLNDTQTTQIQLADAIVEQAVA